MLRFFVFLHYCITVFKKEKDKRSRQKSIGNVTEEHGSGTQAGNNGRHPSMRIIRGQIVDRNRN